MSTIIMIPARMASTRLPEKPLADIGGTPMVVHVARRAKESGVGRIVIATDSDDIAEVVREAGFESVLTSEAHQSGSDRIFEALGVVDPHGACDTVINLQGDLPTIEPRAIAAVLEPLKDPAVEIGTLCVEITDSAERTNQNVVKIVGSRVDETRLRALYFTRATAPWGEGPLYHHVGIYAYRRKSLDHFVGLGPSPLESRERLEQLRALEGGMRIDAEIVRAVPLGVDTPADLKRARDILSEREEA